MNKFALMLAVLSGSAVYADTVSPWQAASVDLAREESKVLDAMWEQDISFWVTMSDDGSSRDGYAGYLCMVLDEAGRPQGEFVSITIWDAASANSGSPRIIGNAVCN